MEYANLLGLAAGTLTTTAFVPQVVKPQPGHPCPAALASATVPCVALPPASMQSSIPSAKTWRTRSTHDISLGMFALFNSGLVLWLLYGVQIGSAPIVIANTITLAFASIILYFKLRYK
jgi:MtN3 and saliva related transmembrane protein